MTTLLDAEQPLDARTVSFLRDRAERPLSPSELLEQLQLPQEQLDALREVLARLATAGEVVETNDGRYGIPGRMNLVVGTLSAHPDGFAFVVTERGERDLFVSAAHLESAVHGDRVVARIEHRRASGRQEGRIIRVLQRARRSLVGHLQIARGEALVSPLDPRLTFPVRIQDAGSATSGQVVHVEIDDFPSRGRAARGRVLEVLGEFGDASIDADIVIREFGLPHAFSDEALAEAEAIGTEVVVPEGREDFRDLPIVTIDGESAKDFDDAVHVEALPGGGYRLQVHIADVSYYVPQDSLLDREARERGTSVYFPDRVVPMLPEALSNEICSLKPGVDRLVQSAVIDIDASGKTVNYEFHDGVIRSAARVTYKQVAAMLGGESGLPEDLEGHRQHFETMRDLAMILVEHRRQRGSIDFDLPEPELLIDLRGHIEDIVRAERNVAHRIIEEFMIRANEVVASHLTWEGMETVYRVHDGPDPEKVERLRDFISPLGHALGGGKDPQPRHFMELLGRVAGRPEERVVSTLLLRTMKQARYQVGNEGHFGLASPMYTHFTSPIRRYPDLIVHRLLRAERGSTAAAGLDVAAIHATLESTAGACSRLERRAEEAERRYCAGKKAQFMADKVGEEYEGHITGVQSFGFFVELEPFFIEGLVPVSSLADDFYRFEEDHHRLRGERGGRIFRLGDRVRVRLAKVDRERNRLDFELLEGPLAVEPPAPVQEDRPRRRRGGRRSNGRGRGRGRDDERSSSRSDGDQDGRSGRRESTVAASAGGAADGVPERSQEDHRPEADHAARADSGGDDGNRRRRRRGTRGGRNRSGRGRSDRGRQQPADQTQRESQAPEVRQEAATPDRPADSAEGAERPARSERPQRERRGGRGRGRGDRDGRREGGEARGRTEGKPEDGGRSRSSRSDRGRGRGRPERTERPAVRPAAAPATPVRRNETAPADRPAVNPYLTDVDF